MTMKEGPGTDLLCYQSTVKSAVSFLSDCNLRDMVYLFIDAGLQVAQDWMF